MSIEIDCGDNSCLFGGRAKGGMRTNGGCRCVENAGFHRSMMKSIPEMLTEVLTLREQNARHEARIREIEAERDDWRAKALDCRSHPVVAVLRDERDAARAEIRNALEYLDSCGDAWEPDEPEFQMRESFRRLLAPAHPKENE